MCGRFVATTPADALAEQFGAVPLPDDELDVSWNVAPTDRVHAVAVRRGERRLGTFRWGLLPSWSKDPTGGARMINARAETVATKPAFRRAFAKRRCLVPADGFYEWEKVPGSPSRQPWFVHSADGRPFAFAGLWEVWRDPRRPGDDPPLRTCAIVTTQANAAMARIHDRMPVILPESAWEQWLDPDAEELDALAALLVPTPEPLVVMHRVGPSVGAPRNNDPSLVEPWSPPDPDDPEAGADRPGSPAVQGTLDV